MIGFYLFSFLPTQKTTVFWSYLKNAFVTKILDIDIEQMRTLQWHRDTCCRIKLSEYSNYRVQNFCFSETCDSKITFPASVLNQYKRMIPNVAQGNQVNGYGMNAHLSRSVVDNKKNLKLFSFVFFPAFPN